VGRMNARVGILAAILSSGTLSTAASADPCTGASVELSDIGEDVRELWQGIEVPESGKRVSQHPRFTLKFSGAVDGNLVAQAAQLSGQAAELGYDGAPLVII
jgi:hypothetical protein